MFASSWFILLFPLAGFIFLSWYGNRISKILVGSIGCGVVGASFLTSLVALSNLLFLPAEERVGKVQVLYQWISSGNFKLDLAILVDPLSVFMFLIVTGVGFVIHIYSIGYMHDDPEYARFFSYLNLFIFSMLVLVAAADFFFLIVGWALVGLASYLLIGFYKEKTSAVLAARKAFVMNVIGDVGMVIAAFVIFESFGTLNFIEVFAAAPGTFRINDDQILLITLLLLVGAFAKSAQLPLHTWLPDAMEGPTPVSALIHAATMVTAGVYLIARCHVLYELAPFTMYLIATVGVLTAIFEMVQKFREIDNNTPIVLMGYLNTFLSHKNLIEENKKDSVDSILVVDIPGELNLADYGIKNQNINTISLISPTTNKDRIKSIAENSTGFVYYVTLRGVTGASNLNINEITNNIEEIKKYASVPTLAGFGIKSPEDAKLLSSCSDGVIVGSSIVKMIEENSQTKEFDRIGQYISELKQAIS